MSLLKMNRIKSKKINKFKEMRRFFKNNNKKNNRMKRKLMTEKKQTN